MIAKTNLDHIKEKTNECIALAGRVLTWLENGEGDGERLADELWHALGCKRDGTLVDDGLCRSLDLCDAEGYEAGIKLIYQRCVRGRNLPEWVRAGMRDSYTDMLTTVYDIYESEVNADVNVLIEGKSALNMCSSIGNEARLKLRNGE